MVNSPTIVLLGAGNVATSLALAFQRAGLELLQIYSRSLDSAAMLSESLKCPFTTDLAEIRDDADLYVCSLKDDVLADVLARIPSFGNGLWVHTSGSLPLDVFKQFTPRAGVFYPLQTFSRRHPVPLKGVPACLETARPDDMPVLEDLAGRLNCRPVPMDSDARACLHLAAVFANNFTNSLYAQAADILSEKDLDFSLLLPLIDETARKVHEASPRQAQTGPAIRQDRRIIGKHIQWLDGHCTVEDAAQLKTVYELMTETIHRQQQ